MVTSIKLNYARYFTHFSLLLFFINFMLPFTSKIKFLLLINSIIVGIVGNLICIKDYTYFTEEYKSTYPDSSRADMDRDLLLSNFMAHTLPMIISFILVLGCISLQTYYDAGTFFIFEVMLFLFWACLPDNGTILQEKISISYYSTQFTVLLTLISSVLLLLSMKYIKSHF